MARPARRLSGLDPEEIKAKVRMAGETMVGLARKHEFSPSYLRNALTRRLFTAEQIIAGAIGIPAHEIWPDHYDAKGNPLHRGRAAKPKRRARHLRFVKDGSR